MTATIYDITDGEGATVEADDLRAALVAARDLVDSGSDRVRVTDPFNRWVATARRVNGGIGIHMIQGASL